MFSKNQPVLLLLILCLMFVHGHLLSQTNNTCETDDRYHKIDFWLGDWEVFSSQQKVGTNSIYKILKGCAIIENWVNSQGNQGKSFFYVDIHQDEIQQVWVTESGFIKEKKLVAEFANGSVRFQGEWIGSEGGTILDRTTLTPLEDGRVRQLIETSKNQGNTWETSFDAYYVRKNVDGK